MARWGVYGSREFARNNHHFYKRLVAERRARLAAPTEREQVIVANSFWLKAGQFTSRVLNALVLIATGGGLVFLLAAPRRDRSSVLAATVVAVSVTIALRWFLTDGMNGARTKLLAQDPVLAQASTDAERAQTEIGRMWDDYNVNYRGYPPDWRWRKEDVRRRDGDSCTKCGWPSGARRRKRNLHVHHRVPVARGGNNGSQNLTTLCHVCHREEEGAGHRRIRYRRPDR